MPTEVMVIHVGQGGIQMGNAVWELLCIEHGITPDGDCIADKDAITMQTFFQEVNGGRYCPRVIFVDSEPSVVDEIRSGAYRDLYHSNQLINGDEDAASNFARGSFVSGPAILKNFRNRLKNLTEQSDYLESILIFNSVGGGTGSGVTSLLLEEILLDYPKVTRMQMPIFSGPSMSVAVVEPYNTIMHVHTSIDSLQLSILFDNEALYDICYKLLLINHPTYEDLNRVVSAMVSSITCSLRYDAANHTSLKEIRTNLVPYPRVHFSLVRHAPLQHQSRSIYSNFSIDQITNDVFSKTHQSVKCDTNRGRFISIILNYRGFVSPKEINEAVLKQKSNLKNFVEWCPTGFKLGINVQGPIVVPDSQMASSDKGVTMICNSTAIKEIWNRIGKKFDLLFSKRAFVHWFVTEGMEESEFGESRVDLAFLEDDYEEIGLNEFEIVEKRESKIISNSLKLPSHDAELELD